MNRIRKALLVLAVLLSVFSVDAQDKSTDLTIYGWVRGDFIYDSRECLTPFDGHLLLYPLKPSYDPQGEDIYESGTFGPSMLVTRVGINVDGPEILGAKVSGRIETDFAGSDDKALLRLRHAWTKLSWDKSSLLIGQTWHLMFSEHCFPTVIAVNTGLPFQPFARNPQIRYSQNLGDHFTFLGSAAMQVSYKSNGPDGYSNIYSRRSSLPNLHGQFQFRTGTFLMGAAYDFKALKPTLETTGANGESYKSDNKLYSHTGMVFASLTQKKLLVKAKGVYGQNLTDYTMLGGYGVSAIDATTGNETYVNSSSVTSWLNVVYGKELRVSLFGGYMKNLGFEEDIVGSIYARSADVDQLTRVSLSLIKTWKNLDMGVEYDATTANYGDIDYSNRGKVVNDKGVTNHRFSLSMTYNFKKKI